MAIKNLLVDFDGVIRHWSNAGSAIERSHFLPKNSLVKTAFSKKLLIPAIRGEVSDEQWRQSISRALALEYPESHAEQAVFAWSKSIGIIDNDVLSLFESFDCAELALVTNATSRLKEDLSVHGIADSFDHIFNSSEIGYIKPEAQLYTHVLVNLGATPANTVFIDDSPENIKSASSLGINSHLFKGIDDLRKYLTTVLD